MIPDFNMFTARYGDEKLQFAFEALQMYFSFNSVFGILCLFQALKSLQKYPLVLESAKECKVLQHFGDGLCKILEKKLAQHVANGGKLAVI